MAPAPAQTPADGLIRTRADGTPRRQPLTTCPRCGGTPRAKADGTPRKHWDWRDPANGIPVCR